MHLCVHSCRHWSLLLLWPLVMVQFCIIGSRCRSCMVNCYLCDAYTDSWLGSGNCARTSKDLHRTTDTYTGLLLVGVACSR